MWRITPPPEGTGQVSNDFVLGSNLTIVFGGDSRLAVPHDPLVDAVLPHVPVRQWVLTLPYRLRYRLAWDHEWCRAVLGVYARGQLAFSARPARARGIRDGQTGTVTAIQRFASGVTLTVHVHPLVLDGVFSAGPPDGLTFHPAPPPSGEAVADVLATIRRRVRRVLVRRHLEPGDADTAPADSLAEASPRLAGLVGASVQGRVALGPRAGAAPGPRTGHGRRRLPRPASGTPRRLRSLRQRQDPPPRSRAPGAALPVSPAPAPRPGSAPPPPRRARPRDAQGRLARTGRRLRPHGGRRFGRRPRRRRPARRRGPPPPTLLGLGGADAPGVRPRRVGLPALWRSPASHRPRARPRGRARDPRSPWARAGPSPPARPRPSPTTPRPPGHPRPGARPASHGPLRVLLDRRRLPPGQPSVPLTRPCRCPVEMSR